jgi:hypothetical protein
MIDPKTIKSECLRKAVEKLYNKSGFIPCPPYQDVAPVPECKNQKEPVNGPSAMSSDSVIAEMPDTLLAAKTNIQPLSAVPNKKQTYRVRQKNKCHSRKQLAFITRNKESNKREWLIKKRHLEAIEYAKSRAGIALSNDDPHLFNQIMREIEHPYTKHYTTGKNL